MQIYGKKSTPKSENFQELTVSLSINRIRESIRFLRNIHTDSRHYNLGKNIALYILSQSKGNFPKKKKGHSHTFHLFALVGSGKTLAQIRKSSLRPLQGASDFSTYYLGLTLNLPDLLKPNNLSIS